MQLISSWDIHQSSLKLSYGNPLPLKDYRMRVHEAPQQLSQKFIMRFGHHGKFTSHKPL